MKKIYLVGGGLLCLVLASFTATSTQSKNPVKKIGDNLYEIVDINGLKAADQVEVALILSQQYGIKSLNKEMSISQAKSTNGWAVLKETICMSWVNKEIAASWREAKVSEESKRLDAILSKYVSQMDLKKDAQILETKKR